MSLPTIYCINLKSREDRKFRMENRFKYRDLKFKFVEAVNKNSSILNYYDEDIMNKLDINGGCSMRATVACFASHLKAIRTFLESNEDEALICEDDVIPHNNFSEKFLEVRKCFPNNCSLVSFSYFPCDNAKYVKISETLYSMGLNNIWGTQLYWISKRYALACLKLYDKPGFGIDEKLKTSEIILQRSNGCVVIPMLAIEDCIDSDIRDDANSFSHIINFGNENYDYFSLGEDCSSPISNKNIKTVNKRLINYRNSKQFESAVRLGKAIFDSNDLYDMEDMENFLQEYYVSTYYIDKNLAKSIKTKYMNLVNTNDLFKNYYEKHKDFIDKNFSYIS